MIIIIIMTNQFNLVFFRSAIKKAERIPVGQRLKQRPKRRKSNVW